VRAEEVLADQEARANGANGAGAKEPASRQPPFASSPDVNLFDERTMPARSSRYVPPVRTIVVDREPVPVVPQQDRGSLRTPSSTGPERLHLDDVSVAYGPKQAVRSVSLTIHQGEVLALIGPSGCGKTTLLRTLNRLTELTPTAARGGTVLLDGEDIHSLADTSLRSRVAMVFQQPNPFPMSIFDNVAFALREQSRKRPRRRELEPLVIDALRRAGLYDEVRDELDRPALRLSGGQQQRLCIARAIAPRPEVLLMDEPCSALDPISTSVIENLIGELRRELALVIVTHNLAQAHRIADKVAFMYLGDLIEYGTTEQVFEEPRASRTRDYVSGAFG
jgi:phosphate transport system ATP-binding protein